MISVSPPAPTGAVLPPTVNVTPAPDAPVTVAPPLEVVFTVPEVPAGNDAVAIPPGTVTDTGPPVTSLTSTLWQVKTSEPPAEISSS